eukprot:CAMPEP_0184859184 /NCGR_PEP_ID=MMETSP0580-20130426/4193_1 /TAXON_ID=1118495 /ORGANISM="Dactyliosolen fragilissimus" /LENGTH=330 /DNA_ID=CAMNT_0027355667 /DNA_START=201 /DNA_END=1193 /DNA_ORIENTATION=-
MQRIYHRRNQNGLFFDQLFSQFYNAGSGMKCDDANIPELFHTSSQILRYNTYSVRSSTAASDIHPQQNKNNIIAKAVKNIQIRTLRVGKRKVAKPNGKLKDGESQSSISSSSSNDLFEYLGGSPHPNPSLPSTNGGDSININNNNQHNAELRIEPIRQTSKTFKDYLRIFNLTWEEYKSTWEGFFDNHKSDSKNVDHDQGQSIVDDETAEMMRNATKQAKRNATKNISEMKVAGQAVVENFQETTGVYSKKDFKKWVGVQIKLMTKCLEEFMVGYRTGRDAEIDRVMTLYFKDLEEKETRESENIKKSSNPTPNVNRRSRRNKKRRRVKV